MEYLCGTNKKTPPTVEKKTVHTSHLNENILHLALLPYRLNDQQVNSQKANLFPLLGARTCVKITLTGNKTVGSTKKIKLEEKYLDYIKFACTPSGRRIQPLKYTLTKETHQILGMKMVKNNQERNNLTRIKFMELHE